MPITEYNEAQVRDYVAKFEPDLVYLLDELEVTPLVQANLAALGIVKMGIFARIEATEVDFRKWLLDDFGFDPQSGVQGRVETAKLVEAWDTARQRSTTSRKLEAEAKVTGTGRELLKGVHLALRRAHVKAHGEVDDRRCPGRSYIEARLEQLDDGELEAEPLTKVTTVALEQTSTETGAESSFGVRRDGVVHVVKGQRKAPMPSNPEQLRDTIKVMARHWSMVQLKGAARPILHDYDMAVFDAHLDYVLGDECYRMAEAHPGIRVTPSWELVLAYEHELRKKAIKYVNESGLTLKAALLAARESSDHRTKYLITPLALHGSRSGPPAAEQDHAGGKKRGAEDADGKGFSKGKKGDGKAKKGGKGSGKDGKKDNKKKSENSQYKALRNSADRLGLEFKTKEGVNLCHRFGSGFGCQLHDCAFSHTCAKCGEPHPTVKCPQLRGVV